MVGALFDTNILIDHLQAIPAARTEIARYQDCAISVITWIEVMIGADGELTEPTRRFLQGFQVVPLDDSVAERAVALRRVHRIRLPDAIIWASAQVTRRLLVSRDTKDFPASEPGIRNPYTL